MIKKYLLLIMCLCFQAATCIAATYVKVTAAEDFNTAEPKQNIDVIVSKSVVLGNCPLEESSLLRCEVAGITKPARGKRDAVLYIRPLAYMEYDKVYNIEEEMYGQYTKVALSKEELKSLPYGKVIKSGALIAGNMLLFNGFSYAENFVEGVIRNGEENRLKSGIVNVYEGSPISYISKGDEISIKEGDSFYFVFKTTEDVEEEEKSEIRETINPAE